MRTIKLLRKQHLLTALMLLSGVYLQAQVAIGADSIPQPFSALEIISNGTGGMRLPQMSTSERNALKVSFPPSATDPNKSMGLMIFNTDTKCVDTWNGSVWISNCEPISLPSKPVDPLLLTGPTIQTRGWATVDYSTGNPANFGPIRISIPAGYSVQWYDSVYNHIPELDGVTEWSSDVLYPNLLPGTYTFYARTVKDGVESLAVAATFVVCGAQVGATTWQKWMCHDLGALQEADPFVPSGDLIGHKYRSKIPDPIMTREQHMTDPDPQPNWLTHNQSWYGDVVDGNDPCYRLGGKWFMPDTIQVMDLNRYDNPHYPYQPSTGNDRVPLFRVTTPVINNTGGNVLLFRPNLPLHTNEVRETLLGFSAKNNRQADIHLMLRNKGERTVPIAINMNGTQSGTWFGILEDYPFEDFGNTTRVSGVIPPEIVWEIPQDYFPHPTTPYTTPWRNANVGLGLSVRCMRIIETP